MSDWDSSRYRKMGDAPKYGGKLADHTAQSLNTHRTFLEAYEAYEAQDATMFYPRRSGAEEYAALMAKKEAALRGWIAYCVLCNGGERGLDREFMVGMFGPWANRAVRIERQDDGWALIG